MRITTTRLFLVIIGLFLASACEREVPFMGKHVPIGGPLTDAQKAALAKQVLQALPTEKVRALVHRRFPSIPESQLHNIVTGSTEMTIVDERGKITSREVHLYVDIYQDPPLPQTQEVKEFVAQLFRDELARRGAPQSAPNPP